MIENINWYPGHMKKTRELIAENLKMVDIVIEVIDARIPVSSRNPIIDELVKTKKSFGWQSQRTVVGLFQKTGQHGTCHELHVGRRSQSII